MGSVCPDCIEDMDEEIKDWAKISGILLQRKLSGYDNYTFGSIHMFGQEKDRIKKSRISSFGDVEFKSNRRTTLALGNKTLPPE